MSTQPKDRTVQITLNVSFGEYSQILQVQGFCNGSHVASFPGLSGAAEETLRRGAVDALLASESTPPLPPLEEVK